MQRNEFIVVRMEDGAELHVLQSRLQFAHNDFHVCLNYLLHQQNLYQFWMQQANKHHARVVQAHTDLMNAHHSFSMAHRHLLDMHVRVVRAEHDMMQTGYTTPPRVKLTKTIVPESPPPAPRKKHDFIE